MLFHPQGVHTYNFKINQLIYLGRRNKNNFMKLKSLYVDILYLQLK